MNTQELLWKYAEGQCSEHEKARAEALLAADAQLREEFQAIQEVHAALAGMEAEQPSMRFAQNVMEALPANLHQSTAIEPLLPKSMKTIFWAVVGGTVALAALAAGAGQPARGADVPYFDKLAGGFDAVLRQVPADLAVYFVLVFLAVAALVVMDRMLAGKSWQLR